MVCGLIIVLFSCGITFACCNYCLVFNVRLCLLSCWCLLACGLFIVALFAGVVCLCYLYVDFLYYCVTVCFGCLVRCWFANLNLLVFFMLLAVCCLLVRCCICFSYFIGLLRVSLLLCVFLCRLLFFCVFGFCWCLIVLVWFIV